jgi:hypothetical protein
LISTTTPGGKLGRSAAPGLLLKSGDPFLEEALAPLRNDLARGVQALGDLVVGEPEGGI